MLNNVMVSTLIECIANECAGIFGNGVKCCGIDWNGE